MKNKHKIIFLSATLIAMILFSGINLFGSPPYVYDSAFLFTESEQEELGKKAAELSEKFMIDFVILTTYDNQGKTVEEYSRDFFREKGLGNEVTKTALTLLFDMDSRQLYISSYSDDEPNAGAEDAKFTYDEIIESFGSDDFYYAAASTYLDNIESFYNENDIQIVNNAVPEEATDNSGSSSMYLFTAALLGFIFIQVMKPEMNETYKKEIKISLKMGDYLENSALNIIDKQDRHINTRMSVRK